MADAKFKAQSRARRPERPAPESSTGPPRFPHTAGSFRLPNSLPPANAPAVLRHWLTALLVVLALNFGAWWSWRQRLERRFDPEIRAAAARYGVAPALVKAVVWKESRFRSDARGRAGELGLMQLMEETAFEWAGSQRLANFSHEHVLHPGTNTLAGTYYLGKVMRRYLKTDNPLPYGLADYNAGRGRVLKWMTGAAATNSEAFLAQVDIPSTRAYIRDVSERYAHYRETFR